nr:MAG TPA: hypothetical protein [Caudoviricetes sp.]
MKKAKATIRKGTAANTVGSVAKIAKIFGTWSINRTKINFCASSASATSPESTTKRGIWRSATRWYGGAMCTRFIRCVTTPI